MIATAALRSCDARVLLGFVEDFASTLPAAAAVLGVAVSTEPVTVRILAPLRHAVAVPRDCLESVSSEREEQRAEEEIFHFLFPTINVDAAMMLSYISFEMSS